MTPTLFNLSLFGLAGAGLGFLFFGWLWLSTRSLPRSGWGAFLWLLSLIGRFALVMAGLVWVVRQGDGDWTAPVAALFGFTVVRWLFTRSQRPTHRAHRTSP
ncbi:ATP synthase subunit I [Saccharospirillum salsuginis]|uniref:F1/F0 ATPase, subunit 2 n=1 Tax=Saccharospirillum salsuginis TaxID=418750 RepID=A0A918KFH0_9GAMM|nr:ATP synthase subunit I [Saccharospirillum salsuginis]GGX61854.1 hypothetical protein GCM10007392_32130 [Saccharospirillum salsuginis]